MFGTEITERKEAEAVAEHLADERRQRHACRSGQSSEIRLPGDDEPRDPHADERGDRHERAAARHAADRRAARLRRRPSATRGDALLTIINDILDFSKIEAGRVGASSWRRSSLARAASNDVHRAVRAVRPRRRARARRRLSTTRYPHAVVGDAGRLRQVLANLVSNALKFTHRGSVQLCAAAVSQARATGVAAALWRAGHRCRHRRRNCAARGQAVRAGRRSRTIAPVSAAPASA
ncbi:MAG: hypothetical protein MZW92_75335 [Comamonadaceae bacterium]|nr:hypothetical protein [Comamonadaceae bacterium]